MQELWQLYDEQGNTLSGKGAPKDKVFSQGLLHGAAHVWVWRVHAGKLEVLVQKRAADKRTWPNLLDISAAGHIDLDESPLRAAIRETQEEIGLKVEANELELIARLRARMTAPDGSIENEYRWLYAVELKADVAFTKELKEVSDLLWKDFSDFKRELTNNDDQELYVPQSPPYFERLIAFFATKTTL